MVLYLTGAPWWRKKRINYTVEPKWVLLIWLIADTR
jgi:hypothetical protein